MKIEKQKILVLLAFLLSFACSGVKKADIPTDANPSDVMAKMENDLQDGLKNQYDVLAYEDYEEAQEHFQKAKKKMENNEDQNKVLDELRYSKAYLDRAKFDADAKRPNLEAILVIREKAIDAGVKDYPQLKDEWKKAEKESKKLAAKKVEDVKVDKVRKVQDQYSELELKAIKQKYLGDARARIEDAKDKRAKSLAPKSLREAETDFVAAEGMIAANRYQSESFGDQVAKANKSSDRLAKVLGHVRDKKQKMNEEAAITLVTQEEQVEAQSKSIAFQDKELKQRENTINSQEESLNAKSAELEENQNALTQTQAALSMKQALDSASQKFDNSEAEVYQQNNKLVIRLKALSFDSGKANLPENSDSVLSKVEEVAKELNAKEVFVQGHTDSIGGKRINQTLSEKRAATVAEKLKSDGLEAKIRAEGFGDKVPLSTNKTAEGRAENRRIDIIITPENTNM